MFLQRGATESSWIISYWYSAAFPFASYNLFIKSYEHLGIPIAPGSTDRGIAMKVDDVQKHLSKLASANILTKAISTH